MLIRVKSISIMLRGIRSLKKIVFKCLLCHVSRVSDTGKVAMSKTVTTLSKQAGEASKRDRLSVSLLDITLF